MAGTTPNLGLYLPGGGSTGLYTPDEVADIDPLNENFMDIDTAVGGVQALTDTNTHTKHFKGTTAAIGSVAGMTEGDTYQETDSDKRTFVYRASEWLRYARGITEGTAAQRAATKSQYWEMWKDTDTDQYIWVGDTAGGWRRFSGSHTQAAGAWDSAPVSGSVSMGLRTLSITIPTVLSADESLLISVIGTGTGFGYASIAGMTRNPTDTSITVRHAQVGSTATNPVTFAWQVVRHD